MWQDMVRSLSDLPQLQSQDNGRDPDAAILVCGYNDLVELTLQALEAFGQRALVVDPQPLPTPIHRWRQL
ncbi:MAG: hypothetical protein SNJ68_05535, partial [Cyanobacteriota bacterium]